MRVFNTSGACVPEEHYTLMREALVAQGEEHVRRGRYFTLFAPRQSGKTTYFQLLFRQLSKQGYLPIWLSMENLKTVTRAEFYDTFNYELQQEFTRNGLVIDYTITNQVGLQHVFDRVRLGDTKVVLVLDEFESIPEVVLSELLHTFRKIYHRKVYYALHSLLLVGVSTLAELVTSSASPFNIVDQLQIPYFTADEVRELIHQHATETGQHFDEQVIKAIYDNTQGQPGLVNALCQHLVDVMVKERTQPVTLDAFYPTLKHFLTERYDKNILNIVQKAKLKQDFMLRVLFDETPLPFTVDHPTISFLYVNGVIDNVHGFVQVPVPLYSKRLIIALRPDPNGETKEYGLLEDNFSAYIVGNRLNVDALLTRYREYVQRRGFHAFDTEHLKEGAWHYSLDGFITFFIQQLGGDTLVEVPSGRGRTDILILYKGRKYIIETKIFLSYPQYQHGKQQLADYLHSEQVDEGFYVVFTQKHSASDTLFFDELINGKRIRTYLIRVDFEPPSTRALDEKTARAKPVKTRRKKK